MFLKICFLSYIINSAIAQCELLFTFTKSFNFFINSRNHIKKKMVKISIHVQIHAQMNLNTNII